MEEIVIKKELNPFGKMPLNKGDKVSLNDKGLGGVFTDKNGQTLTIPLLIKEELNKTPKEFFEEIKILNK